MILRRGESLASGRHVGSARKWVIVAELLPIRAAHIFRYANIKCRSRGLIACRQRLFHVGDAGCAWGCPFIVPAAAGGYRAGLGRGTGAPIVAFRVTQQTDPNRRERSNLQTNRGAEMNNQTNKLANVSTRYTLTLT